MVVSSNLRGKETRIQRPEEPDQETSDNRELREREHFGHRVPNEKSSKAGWEVK